MTVSSSNPLRKYKHIIWDWNGTLLNDAELCVGILNQMLTKRQMSQTTLTEYQEIFDFPVANYYKSLGFDFSKESFDLIAGEFISQYETERGKCKLQAGALTTIKKIKAAGILQSVLSASERASLIAALEMFELSDFFEHTAGLNDHYAHSKVDVGKKLLNDIGTSPEKILLIGDTTHDYEVSQQMGIDCVLIPAGHQSKRRLLACGAKVRYSFEDLIAY
ncbi:MAG: HAD hydrolase-like protein [Phycisphaerae bacterium]|jgi:phosphoglycolate phosphatase